MRTIIINAKTLKNAKDKATKMNNFNVTKSKKFNTKEWKKNLMEKYNLSEYDKIFDTYEYDKILLSTGKLERKSYDTNYYIFEIKEIKLTK